MAEVVLGYIVTDRKGSPIIDFYCRTRDIAKAIALFKLNIIKSKRDAFNSDMGRGAWTSKPALEVRRKLGLRVRPVYTRV